VPTPRKPAIARTEAYAELLQVDPAGSYTPRMQEARARVEADTAYFYTPTQSARLPGVNRQAATNDSPTA